MNTNISLWVPHLFFSHLWCKKQLHSKIIRKVHRIKRENIPNTQISLNIPMDFFSSIICCGLQYLYVDGTFIKTNSINANNYDTDTIF